MRTFEEVKNQWEDTAETAILINETFKQHVDEDPFLSGHRNYVEQNIWGFGERSFHWMWWLIVDSMPEEFTFMEIGVFRGQVLSLIEMIAELQGKKAHRYGVTPLNTAGGMWESNYRADILKIHEDFNLATSYNIIEGDSTDIETIKVAKLLGLKLNILYVDGGHKYGEATSDLVNYTPFLVEGGLLVVDDCANDFKMPWGYFQGIKEVTDAVKDNVHPEEFEFQWSVVHNKIFKKL